MYELKHMTKVQCKIGHECISDALLINEALEEGASKEGPRWFLLQNKRAGNSKFEARARELGYRFSWCFEKGRETSDDVHLVEQNGEFRDVTETTKMEAGMNEYIVRLFPKTADAVLVAKHVGNISLSQYIGFMGKEKELLAECAVLENAKNAAK